MSTQDEIAERLREAKRRDGPHGPVGNHLITSIAREIAAVGGDAPAPARDAGPTEDQVKRAANAVVAEWRAMCAERGATPGQIAREFVSPGNHRLIRAALSAYDAPDVRSVGSLSDDLTAAAAALSDAAAVRDAALAEAATVLDAAATFRRSAAANGADSKAVESRYIFEAGALEEYAAAIRALRSSPPPEPVTEEDFRQWLEEGIRAGDDLDSALGHCAAAAAESFIILRKPGA